jgi:hypothetical protein
MLRVAKWLKHDPFRLCLDYQTDDISCLEELGSVILKYDDEYDDDEEDDDWDDDDFYDDDDDDEDDEYEEDGDGDDDEDSYRLNDVITVSDRWIVCEDDHYGETDNETEDIEIIN